MNTYIKSVYAAVDIGNTRIKFLIEDKFYAVNYYKKEELVRFIDEFTELLNSLQNTKIIIGFSSVNNTGSEIFHSLIRDKEFIQVIYSDQLFENQRILEHPQHFRLGSDRLFGLIGALKDNKPPVITIDFGTAVTVNIADISTNPDFYAMSLGGTIFPDIDLQIKSLLMNTSKIKNIDYVKSNNTYGTQIEDSVSIGVYNSVFGGIKEIVNKIKSDLFHNKEFNLILTGGRSFEFIDSIKAIYPNCYIDNQLVIKGILYSLSYPGSAISFQV